MKQLPLATSIVRSPALQAGEVVLLLFTALNCMLPLNLALTLNSFELLVLNFAHPDKTAVQLFTLVIVYRPPGPFTTFLSEFADFLANLVINTDNILIVGDFNIHVDNKNYSLRSAFLSITDSIGFSQLVDLPTHCCNHTLDLVLTYGTDASHLATMPHNPLLSDHYPITFNFPLPCNIKSDSKFSFRHTISSGAAKAFTELFPGSYCRVNEDSIAIPTNPNLAEINQIADSIQFTLRKTLDAAAPLKRKENSTKKACTLV